jgi:hypothetical protein
MYNREADISTVQLEPGATLPPFSREALLEGNCSELTPIRMH